jgi:hypothetical protein
MEQGLLDTGNLATGVRRRKLIPKNKFYIRHSLILWTNLPGDGDLGANTCPARGAQGQVKIAIHGSG